MTCRVKVSGRGARSRMASVPLATGVLLGLALGPLTGCKTRTYNADAKKINIPVAPGQKVFAFHRVFRKDPDAYLTREVHATSRGQLELQKGEGTPLPAEWARLLPAFGASSADPARLRIDQKEGTPLHNRKGAGINCTWTYLGKHAGKALAVAAGHCLSNNDMEDVASICHRMVIDWEKIDSDDNAALEWAAQESARANPLAAPSNAAPTPAPATGRLRTRCKEVLSSYHYNRAGKDSPAWSDHGFEQWSADYAVIALDVSEGEPRAHLDVAKRRPEEGEEVTLFSHPRGRALEWSGSCQARFLPYDVWRDFQRTSRKNGAYDYDYDARIQRFIHFCNTQEGSSGAAVISVKDKAIIGFHNGGVSFAPAWRTLFGDGAQAEMHKRWNLPYTPGTPLNVATFTTWVPWEGVLDR